VTFLGLRIVRLHFPLRLKKIAFESLSAVIISFVSVRTFLLGNGFYLYSDQSWPIGGNAYPPGIFSPTVWNVRGASLFQFTRDFLTWPYYILRACGLSTLISEKIFLFYTFCFFLGIAFVFANLLFRTLREIFPLSTNQVFEEIFKLVIVLVAFANLDVINLNSNGGEFTDSLIVLLMAISVLAIVTWKNSVRSGVLVALLMSVSFLLNPDYSFMFVAAVAVGGLARALVSRQFRPYVTRIGIALGAAVPSLLFIFYGITQTYATTGPWPDYRSFSLQGARAYTANLSPLNAFILLGSSWSNLDFGPPTILGYGASISSVQGTGFPTQVLVPPGLPTDLWILSLFALPFISLTALLPRDARRLSLPSISILAVAIIFTQYPYIPVLADAVSEATALPVIGPAIGTAFALPDHFLQLIAVSYLLLFPTGLYFLAGGLSMGKGFSYYLRLVRPLRQTNVAVLRSSSDSQRIGCHDIPKVFPFMKDRQIRSLGIVFLMVSLVVLGGWQAFNGSYYPARAYPPFNPPNNVPNVGAFSPKSVPTDVSTAYQFIASQPNLFNVYWPSGGANQTNVSKATAFFSSADFPQPELPLPGLPYLISHHLIADIAPYLALQDVKYFVVQDSGPVLLQRLYGDSNFTSIITELNSSPRLSLALSVGSVYVYEVPELPGYSYPASLLVNYPGDEGGYAVVYSVLENLGIRTAVTSIAGMGNRLSLNGTSATISLLSPDYLSTYANNSFGDFSSLIALNRTWSQGNGNYYLQDWTVTNWGSAMLSNSLASGVMSIDAAIPDSVSVSYKGPLTNQPGGVVVSSPGAKIAVVHLAFSYRTSPGSSGRVLALDVPLNSSLALLEESAQTFPLTSEWSNVEYTAELPATTKYFTTRIFADSFQGELQIRNANMTWTFLDTRADAPYNTVASFSNSLFALPEFTGVSYVEFLGNGSISTASAVGIAADGYRWAMVPGRYPIAVAGDIEMAAIVRVAATSIEDLEASIVVSDTRYVPGIVLDTGERTYRAIPSIESTSLFLDVHGKGLSVYFGPETILEAAYVSLLIYVASLACFSTMSRPLSNFILVRIRRGLLCFRGHMKEK